MSWIKTIDTVHNSYLSFLAMFHTFVQNWSFEKVKQQMKSCSVKGLKHKVEFLVGSHLAHFCFTKSTHFFLRFLAFGPIVIIERYSMQN